MSDRGFIVMGGVIVGAIALNCTIAALNMQTVRDTNKRIQVLEATSTELKAAVALNAVAMQAMEGK